MKSDINGQSTCPSGTEQYEQFTVQAKTFWQYDYRTPGGELFSTVALSLEKCREKRNQWEAKQQH